MRFEISALDLSIQLVVMGLDQDFLSSGDLPEDLSSIGTQTVAFFASDFSSDGFEIFSTMPLQLSRADAPGGLGLALLGMLALTASRARKAQW